MTIHLRHFIYISIIFAQVILATPYNILGIFPFPARSHVNVFLPLMKGLARKGHNVTVISPFPLEKPMKLYTDVVLDNGDSPLMSVLHIDDYPEPRLKMASAIHKLASFGADDCRIGLNSQSMKDFVKNNDTHFDVILAEFFDTDCFLGLVHKFGAPLIGISSCSIIHWYNGRMGNPAHPAYVPVNTMDYSDRLNFFERVENVIVTYMSDLYFDLVTTRNDDRIARKHFGQDMPSLTSIFMNTSLLLVNAHFTYYPPKPLVPAVIEVGGLHVGKIKRPPANLEKWINESAHGVIYFSLGSMIKGHTFPDEKRRAFLKAFERLPQRVLWKWENETMPEKPENVMIQKWMPQLDILCHPNVVAFISHGGLLGTTEAVHCGVPIVVMPQYGDQHTNAKALEANGGGVILKLREATEEMIFDALKKVLDPEFRKGAKELSARFRDRPLPPLETAIYWVEYVARHKGAHHMRTAAVGMPFYKYLLLDVVAFLLAIFAVWAAISFYCVRAVWRRIFRKKELKSTATSNGGRAKQD